MHAAVFYVANECNLFVKRANGSVQKVQIGTRKRFKKMHTEEKSTSQIFRSDAFSLKNEMTNKIFLILVKMIPGDPNGFQTVSDVGSSLVKMVTPAVDAENLTG